MSTDTEVIIDEKIKQETLMPKKFNVILLNDDKHSNGLGSKCIS